MSTTVILIIAAVILGTLYFLKRSARLRKQAKKDF
jgi:outer membrane murein-binding lipoprotein Lpp